MTLWYSFVSHPRYGRKPRITGLDPEPDLVTGSVYLHWHSPEGVRIPRTAIRANLSRQTPATVPVTHYFDSVRTCRDCGRQFLFFAAEQKVWYEELGFPLESDCVRCVSCRRSRREIERQRRRYEELFHVPQRTTEEDLELAEIAITLAEAGLFGKRQLERVRALLQRLSAHPRREGLRERVRRIEGGGPKMFARTPSR